MGLVFVDENLNGKPDPGEDGPSGLVIESDAEEAVTGSHGLFRFCPQPAGIYQLKIITLPDEYCVSGRLHLLVSRRHGFYALSTEGASNYNREK